MVKAGRVYWSLGLILFVVLIPFFAYRELARVLGNDELHSLIFRRGPDAF